MQEALFWWFGDRLAARCMSSPVVSMGYGERKHQRLAAVLPCAVFRTFRCGMKAGERQQVGSETIGLL